MGALFVSTKGAPAIRTRLIAGSHYLKHLHNLSDEQVVKIWTENPYWQYFCGEECFQHQMPIHPISMTKWRNRLGKSGSEKLLIETIKAGLKSKTIKPGSLKKVTVDTHRTGKNIVFPTDSKLLNKASIAVISKEGFVIGAQSCPGNPYDEHTLLPQLEQIKQFTAVQPEQSFVDRGYRCHEVKDTKVFISGQKRGVTRSIKKSLKRRSAIEPEIGHMKNEGRLDRCYLKGEVGDAINVVMVEASHNLRNILNKLRLLWLKIISGLIGCFIKPVQSGADEAMRIVSVARRSAVKDRTQAINQLRALLISAPDKIRSKLWKSNPADCVKGCAHLRTPGKSNWLTTLITTLRLLASIRDQIYVPKST